ncbi:MAG TPA: PEP-CTERM sorting domain-containing protein [Thermoguttaceae bacterium]|nr:PEP-CTERM sorting domain-containing protein [Thermoguttaceae bacterium]
MRARLRLPLTLLAGVGILLWVATPANAAITQSYGPFDVTFYGSGEGVNYGTGWDFSGAGDQDWTAQQMSDIGAAVDAWDKWIGNEAGRQVNMHVYWYDWTGSTLGGSYSPQGGDGTTAWVYGEHVWRDGVNYTGGFTVFDTVILLDSTGTVWNFGSGVPSSSAYDFRSVMTHEIGHSVGFWPTYDGDYDDWGWVYGTSSSPGEGVGYRGLTEWDKNLVEKTAGAENRALSGGAGGTPGDFDETGDVFWDGANAVAYYGDLVPIYAPSTYSSGSSLSHLDEATFGTMLMTPAIGAGQYTRELSTLELAMMQDMKWNVVPEPGSVIVFGGLFGSFLVWHRRRKRPA